MKRFFSVLALLLIIPASAFAGDDAVKYDTASAVSGALMDADLEARYGIDGIPSSKKVDKMVNQAVAEVSEVQTVGETGEYWSLPETVEPTKKTYVFDGEDDLLSQDDMPPRLFNNIKRRY